MPPNRRVELHDAFISLACSLICWAGSKKAHGRFFRALIDCYAWKAST